MRLILPFHEVSLRAPWPPLTPSPAEEPLKGPSITGNENRSAYRVGDLLLLNCSSTFSYPPTTLSWDIDGHKVSKGAVHSQRPGKA